jgi:hypothetical protein
VVESDGVSDEGRERERERVTDVEVDEEEPTDSLLLKRM